MQPNPVLRRLGLADDDRVAIIHADDIGMCESTISAFAELMDFGLVSSGAAMVPCPWFPLAADYCRQHAQVDMGVHLTLTSEWDGLRWGPVARRDVASGLVDGAGYFHRRSANVQQHGSPDAVRLELETQLRRAMSAGIDVTHVDTHMGTVAHPKFVQIYIDLALEHRLPFMIPRLAESGWAKMGFDSEMAAGAARLVERLEADGQPLLDRVLILPLDQPEDRLARAKRAFDSLPIGITHFVIHPGQDTPELRAAARTWPARVADFRTFLSTELRDYVQSQGIHVVGYRALRELIREG
jgi:predicted glycoside hydrolase/deacetylase ChbG (UPF0249 family)